MAVTHDPLRVCSRCRAEHNRPKDTYCKACRSEYGKQQYARTLEASRARHKRWKEENRDRYRAQAKARRETPEGRAAASQAMREWRAKNPERAREAYRKWDREHPDQRRDKFQRYKARLRGAPVVEKVDRAAVYERDGGRCHICLKKVPRKGFSLDHLVPLARGGEHTARNLRVAHVSCNSSRGAGRLPAQLLLMG